MNKQQDGKAAFTLRGAQAHHQFTEHLAAIAAQHQTPGEAIVRTVHMWITTVFAPMTTMVNATEEDIDRLTALAHSAVEIGAQSLRDVLAKRRGPVQ